MASGDLQRLLDEAAIEKAICAWCSAIDGRDWDRMRSLIADPVFIDYSSNGSLKGLIPAEAWVSRLKILLGFDATLHMVSNFVIALDGDRYLHVLRQCVPLPARSGARVGRLCLRRLCSRARAGR